MMNLKDAETVINDLVTRDTLNSIDIETLVNKVEELEKRIKFLEDEREYRGE